MTSSTSSIHILETTSFSDDCLPSAYNLTSMTVKSYTLTSAFVKQAYTYSLTVALLIAAVFLFSNVSMAQVFDGSQHLVASDHTSAKSLFVEDLDGDGFKDIVAHDDDSDQLKWYKNNGDKTFGSAQVIATANAVQSVYVTDMDDDGDKDVVAAIYSDKSVVVYINNGDGTVWNSKVVATAANGYQYCWVADLNKDTKPDIISCSYDADKIYWHKNLGGGNFDPAIDINTAANAPTAVYAADINGDGEVDLVSSSFLDDRILWYENSGGGSFGAQKVISSSVDGAFNAYPVDLDGDGDLDILATAYLGNEVIIFKQAVVNSGIFDAGTVVHSFGNPYNARAADLDGDGDNDIVVTGYTADEIVWIEQTGVNTGSFGAAQTLYQPLDGPRFLHVDDADNDGDFDVFSTSANDKKIAWYENLSAAASGDEFVVVYDLSLDPGSGSEQIEFYAKTNGVVNYTWEEIGGNNASGVGSFNVNDALVTVNVLNIAVGGKVRIKMEPDNLQRFYQREGFTYAEDSKRLIDVEQWGTTQWRSMASAFESCSNLSYFSATDLPDLSVALDMQYMFARAFKFNGEIDDWDVSSVKRMNNMFHSAYDFNGDIGNWNVGDVITTGHMFDEAQSFNQDLGSWKLNANVNMASMFDSSGMDCQNYSATLQGWADNPTTPTGRNLGAAGIQYGTNAQAARDTLIMNRGWTITDAGSTGSDCYLPEFITVWDLSLDAGSGPNSFKFYAKTNGNVNYTWEEIGGNSAIGSGSFNVTNALATIDVTGIAAGGKVRLIIEPENMLRFSQFGAGYAPDTKRLVDVEQWGTTAWESMNNLFAKCSNLPGFSAADAPDLSMVTSMHSAFYQAAIFNDDLSGWNTSSVTVMSSLFNGAKAFNTSLSTWDVSAVEDMEYMFYDATVFNQNIGGWDISSVTDLRNMFNRASSFNADISAWNTASVTDMSYMFYLATVFNADISSWNTVAVKNMSSMFYLAEAFNADIANWNTSNVTNMREMFTSTSQFNADISNWSTAKVSNMYNMFSSASAFNQNLGAWNLASLTSGDFNGLDNAFDNSGMSCENYSASLIGWEANINTPNDITLGAFGVKYGTNAQAARTELTTTKGWTITDNGSTGTVCELSAGCPFTAEITGDTTLCEGDELNLVAQPTGAGYSYTWSGPNGLVHRVHLSQYLTLPLFARVSMK